MKNSNYEFNKLKKNILISLCLTLFIVFCVVSNSLVSANTREKVNISYYNNPIFYSTDDSMNLKGGDAYDLMATLNRYLNWDVNYIYDDFNKSLADLKTGEIDLVFGVYKTPELENKFVFNKEPIAIIPDYICARTDEEYLNGDYTKLNGKRFGFIEGSNSYKKIKDFLEKSGVKVTYVKAKNSNELRKMLINLRIDYFIVNNIAVTENEKIIQKVFTHPMYIMATKDKKELLDKFDASFRRLRIKNPELMKKILKRTDERIDFNISNIITANEKAFIKTAKEIRCGVVENNAPYYYKDEYGKADGVIKAVINKIKKDSGLKFTLIPFANAKEELKALEENKIDAIGMIFNNPYSTQKYDLNLTKAYTSRGLVILKNKVSRIDKKLDNLYAIEKSPFGHEDFLKKEMPNIKFVNYENAQKCVDALNRGEVGAAVVTNFNTKINNNELKYVSDLAIYAVRGILFEQCIGFSNKLDVRYLEITDKILGTFNSKDINTEVINIVNNSSSKGSIEVFFDKYKFQIFLLLAIIIIILVVLYLQSLRYERTELRLGDERFKKAANQAQVSYWEYNYVEKKMIFFDDTWANRHGYKKNIIENYDIEKRKEFFDKETREKILKTAALMETQDEAELQIHATGIDGKIYYYLIKVSAIRDSSKKLIKALGSILDVTNAKNNLNRYEYEVKRNEVMGSMLLASFLVNLTKDEVVANSDCLIAKKDELIGKKYSDFIEIYFKLVESKSQRKNFEEIYLRERLLESFDNGHRDARASIRLKYADKLTWIEAFIHITKDPFTNDVMGIIYVRDAKERETLQSALDLAKAANDAKSNFLSTVSHEIRTPMNAIMGLTDMTIERVKNNKDMDIKVYENLSNIKLSSEYLLTIINDILEMSRIESGKTQLNKKVYDSEAFFKTITTIISMRAREKNIEFTYTPDKNLKRYYIADEVKLKKIFINILGNAIKFTPNNGKVHYTSEIISCDSKRTIVKIIVSDNGIGMNENFLKHIFEPFSRASGNETIYEGTGLGMAISKNFINMMNGDIKIESEVGKGTIVTITLALENEEQNCCDNSEEEKKEDVKIEGNPDFKGLKLLLVEDNKLNAIIATHVLAKMGFKIETAINGKVAIDMFSEKPKDYYSIILMDIRMPVIGGIEATKKIRSLARKDAKTIPIVAMTANAFDIDRRDSLEAGMNEHVTKPIDTDKLSKLLAKLINKKE